jgi:hypothetical protein
VVAADRFAREIAHILKAASGALAAAEHHTVRRFAHTIERSCLPAQEHHGGVSKAKSGMTQAFLLLGCSTIGPVWHFWQTSWATSLVLRTCTPEIKMRVSL